MRLHARVRDAAPKAVVQPGRLTRVLLVGSAAIATVWAGLASALVLAAGLGVGGAVAIAVAEVALIGLAIRQLPARSRASHLSERFERGFDDAAIGMMILSQQLRVLRVNEALCPLLGRGADELVGRSILDFTHPEDRQRSVEKRESMVEGGAEAPLVKRYVRPDGSVVEAIVTIALVEPDVGQPYFFSQLQDVTEQRRAERQKARDRRSRPSRARVQRRDHVDGRGDAHGARDSRHGELHHPRRLASGEVRLVAAEGETFDPTIPPGQPSQTAYTLQVGEPVVSNDLLGEPRFSVPAMIVEQGLHRGLSVPVPERSGARHVIMVHGHAKDRPFTVEDVRFLEAVAHVIAGALDRAADRT